MTRSLALVPLAFAFALSFGCATPMAISTTPSGADITVDGKPVGKSPTTAQIDSGGGPVSIRAKVDGREITKTVPKDQTNWGTVAAGAGVGVGTCCALSAVSNLVAIFGGPFIIVAIPIGCVACLALGAAPVGAYFLWGSKPADQVSVDVGGAAPSGAPIADAPARESPPAPLAASSAQPY